MWLMGSSWKTSLLTLARQKEPVMKKSWEVKLEYTPLLYKDFIYLNLETNILIFFFCCVSKILSGASPL
jgi:hypothetical protein